MDRSGEDGDLCFALNIGHRPDYFSEFGTPAERPESSRTRAAQKTCDLRDDLVHVERLRDVHLKTSVQSAAPVLFLGVSGDVVKARSGGRQVGVLISVEIRQYPPGLRIGIQRAGQLRCWIRIGRETQSASR